MTIKKLGLLAGKGQLPKQLVDHCHAHDIPYFILAFEDSCEADWLADKEHKVIPLGSIGSGLEALKDAGVSDIVLAGHMKRPSIRSLNLDAQAKKLLKGLGMKILGGDDAMLGAVMKFLEDEGFNVLASHEILGGLTLNAGCASKAKPNKEQDASISKAVQILRDLGPMDIGQSLVIEDGYVLGVEAAEGTDELVKRCAGYMKANKQTVLVKAKKSGQDERADMPTIGPGTISMLAANGYAGIAIEANNVLVVDNDQVVELANEHGLFLVAV